MVLPPPIPPQARSPMGPWIEGGYDNVGTRPKRARPRLLWIGYNCRCRATSRQREREGTIESSERAAARAHEGEPTVQVLSKKSKEDTGFRRLDRGIWELGRHLERPACEVWLYRQQAFLGNGEMDDLCNQTQDSLVLLRIPRKTRTTRRTTLRRR